MMALPERHAPAAEQLKAHSQASSTTGPFALLQVRSAGYDLDLPCGGRGLLSPGSNGDRDAIAPGGEV